MEQGTLVYKVTVEGVEKDWLTLDYALADALNRGLTAHWKIETLVA